MSVVFYRFPMDHKLVSRLRKVFCRSALTVSVAFGCGAAGYANAEEFRMTIMHTNDTHSHHEPQGRSGDGGAARQAAVVNDIRAEVENSVLLLSLIHISEPTRPY